MGVSTGGIPYIALQSANGTTNYIYATNAGNIAIGTAEPTTDSSATGGMLTAVVHWWEMLQVMVLRRLLRIRHPQQPIMRSPWHRMVV